MVTEQPNSPQMVVIDTSLVAVIAWIVIAVIVILFLWKIWPLISKAVRALDALGQLEKHMADTKTTLQALDDRLDGVETKVNEVHHETHKNDGSSIKDAVTRIETKQWSEIEAAEEFRQLHGQQFGALVKKDEELEEQIVDHIKWSKNYVEEQEARHGG